MYRDVRVARAELWNYVSAGCPIPISPGERLSVFGFCQTPNAWLLQRLMKVMVEREDRTSEEMNLYDKQGIKLGWVMVAYNLGPLGS